MVVAGIGAVFALNRYEMLTAHGPEGVSTASVVPPGAQAAKEFTVTGANYSFSPSTLTVKKGDRVRIVFQNIEGFHDFRVDELNVATRQIRAGDRDIVEFTPDKAGTFEYYCSVGHHRMAGMRGTLVVTE